MYDRLGMQTLPEPFYSMLPEHTRLKTLDFLQAMRPLLEQSQGLAAVCHGATFSPDVAYQELTPALCVLSGYLEAALVLFGRWEHDVHPGPRVKEE